MGRSTSLIFHSTNEKSRKRNTLDALKVSYKKLQKLKFYNIMTGNFFRLSQDLLSLAVPHRYIGNTFITGRGIIHTKFTCEFSYQNF